MNIQTLECDKIEFPGADDASRSFRKEVAEGLAMSIEAEGMYHPIAVRADPGKPGFFQGVQGRHRHHAQHRILGRSTIVCNVLIMDNDEAAIAAVAENTFRKELSQAERSKALRLWHRMFAAKHPERVGRGKAGRAAMQARKGEGKAAKARGGDGASDQKTKSNRATASANAESEDQKAKLDFHFTGSETEGEAGTATEEHQRTNLNLQSDGQGTDGEGHPATFAKTVAAATGCSETTAKREVRVALNLTDEQLRICDQRQLTKGQVDSIAGINDEAQRAKVIDLIDHGLEFDEAWEQGAPDARKTTGESRAQEAAATAAEREIQPELSDEEWFDRICGEKVALLGSPAAFKADALVFRRITRPRHLFRVEVEETLNDAKAAKNTGPFYDLVDHFLAAGHPNDWPLCGGCGGSGAGRNGAGCTTCRGVGYLLKGLHEDLTTDVTGNRVDRTASPGTGPDPSPLHADSPPDRVRTGHGKPSRPVRPDPGVTSSEAEMAAMFDGPVE